VLPAIHVLAIDATLVYFNRNEGVRCDSVLVSRRYADLEPLSHAFNLLCFHHHNFNYMRKLQPQIPSQPQPHPQSQPQRLPHMVLHTDAFELYPNPSACVGYAAHVVAEVAAPSDVEMELKATRQVRNIAAVYQQRCFRFKPCHQILAVHYK